MDGLSVLTQHGVPVSSSRLVLDSANQNHSGFYKCVPANAPNKTVTVYVLAGEAGRMAGGRIMHFVDKMIEMILPTPENPLPKE